MLGKGFIKEGDQIMIDARLSPSFRKNLISNSPNILTVLEEIKQLFGQLTEVENNMLRSLNKLNPSYSRILRNDELVKFVSYAEEIKDDHRLDIQALLDHEAAVEKRTKLGDMQNKNL